MNECRLRLMNLGEPAASAADFFPQPLCGGRGRLVLQEGRRAFEADFLEAAAAGT